MSETVRILSLDGGGMRGYMSMTFLSRFCTQAGIPPDRIFESFDVISGTSIGGICALAIANGMTPSELLTFFETHGSLIFHYDSILPLSAYKFSVIMGIPTYPSTFYSQAPLKAAIESVFGTTAKLSDLPCKVIIPSWNSHVDKGNMFSNITGQSPFLSGESTLIRDVALATSAAPLYFSPVVVDANSFIDGGVYVNNPVLVSFSVLKKQFPTASRFCVLSVGTGIAYTDFIPETSLSYSAMRAMASDPIAQETLFRVAQVRKELRDKYPGSREKIDFLTSNVLSRATPNSIAPYNVDYLFYLIENVFTQGAQELNSEMMQFETQDLFDDIFYYRFQYEFESGQNSDLDNFSPAQLAALASYANTQYDRDAFKIENFIEHFNAGS